MTAGDFCIREVVICRPNDSVREAARRMRDFHVGCVIAVEERDGARVPVGIITDRDIVVTMVAGGREDFDTRPVADLMTGDPLVAYEHEDLIDVMKRMRAAGVRRMPVVTENRSLEGLITFDDLIDLMSEELSELTRLLRKERRHEESLDFR